MEIMTPRIIKNNNLYNKVQIDKLFKEFDLDGDGYICASELRQSLKKIGPGFATIADDLTDEDVEEILEEILMESDLDGDGKISYSEFAIMIPRLNQIIEG